MTFIQGSNIDLETRELEMQKKSIIPNLFLFPWKTPKNVLILNETFQSLRCLANVTKGFFLEFKST